MYGSTLRAVVCPCPLSPGTMGEYWVHIGDSWHCIFSIKCPWLRLDYQPLFGKISPHSSPSLRGGSKTRPGDGGNRAYPWLFLLKKYFWHGDPGTVWQDGMIFSLSCPLISEGDNCTYITQSYNIKRSSTRAPIKCPWHSYKNQQFWPSIFSRPVFNW